MRKLLVVIIGILFCSVSYATDTSKVEVRASVNDGSTNVTDSGLITKTFTTGVRQTETKSLTAGAFTNISVPSGAKAFLMDIGSSRSLVLKAVTGDVGISLDSVTSVMLPISADNVTFGVLNRNASNQTVTVYWL
jgi:hypothetical protein